MNRNSCKLPPRGWYCTRGEGHEGPCAALPFKRREYWDVFSAAMVTMIFMEQANDQIGLTWHAARHFLIVAIVYYISIFRKDRRA